MNNEDVLRRPTPTARPTAEHSNNTSTSHGPGLAATTPTLRGKHANWNTQRRQTTATLTR
eukprot:15435675-Alexandrium_andersonii.AAC.1